LNFEGNEFGHPEWLDFPRVGNGDSYQHARRQWGLVDDQLLRYRYLNNFDAAMQKLEDKYHWLAGTDPGYVSLKHEGDKVIAYERAGLVFIFNFHPTQSFTDYRVGAEVPGEYHLALSTDDKEFGGFGHVDHKTKYPTTDMPWNGRKNYLQVYIPARTAIVLALAPTA